MEIIFDEETGLLTPGEYKLSIEEFEEAFVYNSKRETIFKGFQKLLKIFRDIECSHIYADGSFVTKKPLPGDIDICWHMNEDHTIRKRQLEMLYRLCPPLLLLGERSNRDYIQHEFCADVFPANTIESGSGLMFKDFFQKDKQTGNPKGIIVIDLI